MIRMTNNEKNTALHGAGFQKNVDVAKILREDLDCPYSANNYGQMALYVAVERASDETVLGLLEKYTSVSHMKARTERRLYMLQ